MKKARPSGIEKDLIEGLQGLAGDLKGDARLPDKYTCRRLVLDLKPRVYGPQEVLAARKILNASQPLFAQFLGVSPKTVRAWEQGKTPSDMACRFMDEIQRDPDYWRNRLLEAAKAKSKNTRKLERS